MAKIVIEVPDEDVSTAEMVLLDALGEYARERVDNLTDDADVTAYVERRYAHMSPEFRADKIPAVARRVRLARRMRVAFRVEGE